jgi:hypothetical protein
LKKLNAQPGRFLRRLDLSNVGLMGQSRGGDAVVKALAMNRGSSDFTIRALCSLAPTDFSGISGNPLTVVSEDRLRYLVLYGSHDGDVGGQDDGSTGTGFRHYDRALCERTMVFVKGAKHDRFNTKWDDQPNYADPFDCVSTDPDFLTPDDHKKLAIEYIGGLFRLELNRDTSVKNLFDGSAAPSGGHDISLQWSRPSNPRTLTTLLHGTPLDPSDKWKTGWTTLVSLHLPGSDLPFELGYQKDTGKVVIDRIDPLTGTDPIFSDTWKKGWTHFLLFTIPGDDRTHDLAYMGATGEVGIDRIARDGKSVEVNVWKDKWSTGWTHFMPVRMPNDARTYYLGYKKDEGVIDLDRIKPTVEQGTENVFTSKWPTGWTSFVPFQLPRDDRQGFLVYNKATGKVATNRIAADGKSIEELWTDSWHGGWTSIVPFRAPGDARTYFVAYKEGDGKVSVDRIQADGLGTETILQDVWTTKWSHFLTFESNSKPHFLSYKVDRGDVAIGRLLPDQMLEVENFEDRSASSRYDSRRDLLNAPSSLTPNLSRVDFKVRFFVSRPFAVPHQTFVLTGKAVGAKYRAEIPPENKVCLGFDYLSFRLSGDFKLDTALDIAAGKFPDFKVRVIYGAPGRPGVLSAEANQGDIDVTGARKQQRPFFRQIRAGACLNGTKITLQTITIPFAKFVGVNWRDVRAIEFETGPTISAAFFFDSLALMQS